ncbi:MAG: metalloregulator ArsR/SmtB family transcription factor [Patescibacteria group bacterium]
MIEDLLVFTKTISDPTRLKILHYLKRECCVGELWEKMELPQNLVSHHLKVLREAGLINSDKKGLKVIYRLNEPTLVKNLNQLNIYLK